MSSSNVSSSNPSWYISGVFGSLGQLTELTLAGQVLSRIMTLQQAQPSLSIRESIRTIYAENGFKSFFKGYRWNAGMSVCKGFTRWSFNNAMFAVCEKYISKETQKNYPSLIPLMAGMGGAMLETTLYLCPLESLKTREMTESWKGKNHMWHVIRSEGAAIFFKGWTGLFPRQAITWATYLIVYDKYRQFIMSLREGKPARTIDKFFMNFMTGATAALLTTPLDLYKTQRQKVDPIQEKNIVSSFLALIERYGIRGLYRSLPMRITRSGVYAVATFTVMDFFNALPNRMRV
jgi:hypothetical protein